MPETRHTRNNTKLTGLSKGMPKCIGKFGAAVGFASGVEDESMAVPPGAKEDRARAVRAISVATSVEATSLRQNDWRSDSRGSGRLVLSLRYLDVMIVGGRSECGRDKHDHDERTDC